MRTIPNVKWNGEPSCDDSRGYHFTISADSRDEIVAWMVDAESEIKQLKKTIEIQELRRKK